MTLLIDNTGLSLLGYGLKYQGDFTTMLSRISEKKIQHELLVHVTKTKNKAPVAIDATAGMGEDALLLAASGYEVTLFERNSVIAALLQDTIRRSKKHPLLKNIVNRMHFVEGDSISLLPLQKQVDLIYLDPMFPARNKTGKSNKKLQLLQKLESPCLDGEELVKSALLCHPKKIVIKRPLKGGYLGNIKPGYSVSGRTIRYDCLV